MTRKTKCALLLAMFLAGVSIVTAGNPTSRQSAIRRASAAEQRIDPYENRTVLLEGFVVQVDLTALREMDVNPLGQAPRAVSVVNLLQALTGNDGATVVVGAKVAAAHGAQRSQTRRAETTYYLRKQIVRTARGTQEAVDHAPYDNGATLSMSPIILSDTRVRVGYDFDYNGPRGTERAGEGPLDSVSWSWEGIVSLDVGHPRIVGATQDEKTTVFFVLTAHLLD